MDSETPVSDKIVKIIDGFCRADVNCEISKEIQKLERWLRYFRDRANNYVPDAKLREVDKFLNP